MVSLKNGKELSILEGWLRLDDWREARCVARWGKWLELLFGCVVNWLNRDGDYWGHRLKSVLLVVPEKLGGEMVMRVLVLGGVAVILSCVAAVTLPLQSGARKLALQGDVRRPTLQSDVKPTLQSDVKPGSQSDGRRAVFQAPTVSTFSIVAIDPVNGDLGVAVASRYFSVGSVVPWALAGVGAVATQANVNVGYGPRGIDLLRQGLPAKEVLDKLLAEDTFEGKDGRQVAIVDAHGNVAAYTGSNAPNWAGDRQGKTWSAQGNILVGPQVPEAMGRAFESTQGELAERLYAALKAGDDAGGDKRGHQSASMLVVRKQGGRNINNDRYIYVNVDDNPKPLAELRRLLDLNLFYLYGEASDRLLTAGKKKEALEAQQTAARYAPEQADSHIGLGFLQYVNGNKEAALAEFRQAQKMDKDFRKQFDATIQFSPELKGILEDKDFLAKLFPNK
ncbi:MAG TPA: DUF1028 domain-containing protein [Candidatus Acidoferrum sp.]